MEESHKDDDEWRITDDELKKRILHKERGSIFKQTLLAFGLFLGAFSFGYTISWGGPTLVHLPNLEYQTVALEQDYGWLVTIAPLAASIGILSWAFLTKRIGRKKTILLQTPLLVISWIIKALHNNYKVYCFAHFLSGFCAISYVYTGDIFLIECIHRNNLKVYYAFFRSSIILGILTINIINTRLDKLWLCLSCGVIPIIIFCILFQLPDSPVYLMEINELKAIQSLQFYIGRVYVTKEINVIKQYVQLISMNNKHMLRSKVVYLAILIIFVLQIFRTMTGYYVFVIDSVKIITAESSLDPYMDLIIYGLVLYIARLAGTLTILYGNFGVRKPMIISMSLMAIVLLILGTLAFFEMHLKRKWLMVLALSLYAVAYDIGMDLVPETLVYQYMPIQLYDFVTKLMTIFHWFLIFLVVRFYMWLQINFGVHVAFWTLAVIAFFGLIFIIVFVVETKGMSLVDIQVKLGGNPVGSRGSIRQRITNPFEPTLKANYLNLLISSHTVQ